MDIVKINIASINPAPYNPRKDLKPTDPEYIKLKNSIHEFGYVEPIIVNRRNNVIIGGHQRYKVLKDLGYSEIDIVYVDLDDAHEKSLNIALNKISGDWDADKLEDLIREIDLDDSINTSLTGFDRNEIDKLLGMLEDDNNDDNNNDDNNDDNNNNNLNTIYELIIDCENEKDMNDKFNILKNNHIDCRINTI